MCHDEMLQSETLEPIQPPPCSFDARLMVEPTCSGMLVVSVLQGGCCFLVVVLHWFCDKSFFRAVLVFSPHHMDSLHVLEIFRTLGQRYRTWFAWLTRLYRVFSLCVIWILDTPITASPAASPGGFLGAQ